jgi:DNA-directed RNA polymerase subunit RPC12/RpoP
MNGYYCLNCGEKLKQLSTNPSTDKYECPKCCTTWYKVRHIIIEWVEGEKKESEDEEE